MKKLCFLVIIVLILGSCSDKKSAETISLQNTETDTLQKEFVIEKPDSTYQVKSRLFVDSGYQKRKEGNDWIAVQLDSIASDTITVKVFSRSDIKKQTCNFYSKAFELEKGIYKSINTDPVVMFTLDENVLHIGGISDEENEKLMFYCSNGGNLVGDYKLLTQPIDTIRRDSLK